MADNLYDDIPQLSDAVRQSLDALSDDMSDAHWEGIYGLHYDYITGELFTSASPSNSDKAKILRNAIDNSVTNLSTVIESVGDDRVKQALALMTAFRDDYGQHVKSGRDEYILELTQYIFDDLGAGRTRHSKLTLVGILHEARALIEQRLGDRSVRYGHWDAAVHDHYEDYLALTKQIAGEADRWNELSAMEALTKAQQDELNAMGDRALEQDELETKVIHAFDGELRKIETLKKKYQRLRDTTDSR